jgi:hypothetical protein
VKPFRAGCRLSWTLQWNVYWCQASHFKLHFLQWADFSVGRGRTWKEESCSSSSFYLQWNELRGPSSYIRGKFSDTITGILLSTRGRVLKTLVGLIHVAAVGKLIGLFWCMTFKLIEFLNFLHRKVKSKVHPRTGHESPKGRRRIALLSGAVGWGTALQPGRSRVRFRWCLWNFSLT